MLEETLNSTTYSPAEVAQMLISYVEVELSAGGASAEARFFQLFPLLCKRVFGDISLSDQYKHEFGGWLSRTTRWEQQQQRSAMSSSSSSSSLAQRESTHHRNMYGGQGRSQTARQTSIRTDPVVKLLGITGATTTTTTATQGGNGSGNNPRPLILMEAFAKEAEHRPSVRYSFPFPGLPKSMQRDWLSLIQLAMGGVTIGDRPVSENSTELMGVLFRVKPLEQVQLILYQQAKAQQENEHRRPLQLTPLYAQSPTSPLAAAASIMGSPNKANEMPPNVLLSMLEYYLVVFIRYPTAAPLKAVSSTATPIRTSSVGATPSPSRTKSVEDYGDAVYYELFQQYVSYYIPSRVPLGSFNGFGNFPQQSQLFVRIIIALWLEGLNQMTITTKAVDVLRDRAGLKTTIDLNASFDLVHARHQPLPAQVSKSLHVLIKRTISDGSITDLVRDIHQGFKGPNPDILAVSPTMAMLQQPFFNHIRTAFRYGSVHSSKSIFYSAMTDWLMWLEPWNMQYSTKSSNSSTRMLDAMSRNPSKNNPVSARFVYAKMNDRSLYKPFWEAYIASNLHFYTVPLAIFLRRARELDFSPPLYKRSFEIVMKVLRVYTPEVVAVINRLLSERSGSSAAAKYAGMVAQHEKKLGPFVPPGATLSLASCQEDMNILLEEVYLQHLKKEGNADMGDWISSFFGISGTGTLLGEERQLQNLFLKAKIVVGFPPDYEVAAQYHKSRISESQARRDATAATRTKGGSLSSNGVQCILRGSFKCHADEMDYYGDKMYARPQSHEIPFLVTTLIKVSDALNVRLGINNKGKSDEADKNTIFRFLPHRVNLRFLADYRNILILCLIGWLMWTVSF